MQRYGKVSRYDSAVHTDLSGFNCIVFTGGADVDPYLYGQKIHPFTFTSKGRDDAELEVAEKAIELNIPLVGICRGAQLLSVVSGDTLIQHVTGHLGRHYIVTNDRKHLYNVTSTHHQMMRGELGCMLAYSYENRSDCYEDGDENEYKANFNLEPEVIWYKDTKALCVQFHPEQDVEGDSGTYFNTLMKEYIMQ